VHTNNKNQALQAAKTNQTESKLDNDAGERERNLLLEHGCQNGP
jgi:hypothetical protein